MEKLELKHLAPYLPYELRLKNISGTYHDLIGLCNKIEGNEDVPCDFIVDELQNEYYIECVKPILRPISDIKKVMEYNGIKASFYNYIAFRTNKKSILESLGSIIEHPELIQFSPWMLFEELLKNHFDVFGLIDKGLAIDINTLKQE